MKKNTILKITIGSAVLVAGTAALAKDIRPADAAIKVGGLNQPNSSASEKSQGLPNADGGKPGAGNGYGHLKDMGRGHGKGRGHGHDGEPESP
jgi:hypothetical protein